MAYMRATLRDVTLTRDDSTILAAWLITPSNPTGDAVILLHGVTDTRAGVAGYGELFLSRGYTILLPDARGHGESGGELMTYGVLEAQDIHAWVDWLRKDRSPKCVYGFGESMGAAILLQSLKYETRFCAVIAESAFAEFREGAYDRVSEKVNVSVGITRTLFRPSVEAGIAYAKLRYGVDLGSASPRAAVAGSMTPVLLIHGIEDVNIRPRNSALAYAARPNSTELWLVPKAAHCGAWSAQPQEFERRVVAWYQDHRTTNALIQGLRHGRNVGHASPAPDDAGAP
ncbi:MAG: alpha/beta fold hydrolase [Acidobacteriales bacterium]|nr:alpha/beta fold hydrolase [Terriglobales bacterium]